MAPRFLRRGIRFLKNGFARAIGLGMLSIAYLNIPAAAQDAANLPDGPGKDKVAAACNGCHGLGQIISQRQTAERWTDIVTRMATNGAPVADSDFDMIVSYLTANFGPNGAAPPSPTRP
jgi:mono/diheme cytochrome c family protein